MRINLRNIWLITVILIIALPFISAVQPTQQFNKIYLNPFYRASLAANTNVTYTVSVNPPDKVSVITSAIISFNVQINGQSQAISLWVNGKQCNNPTYSVATAFSTTGQVQMYFDCSNVITQAGTYTVTINSGVATGTVSGWLDLTYSNSPKGTATVHGTEYKVGETAKMWLQLINSTGSDISNGVCYVDIYTPQGGTFVERATMTNMGHDGIYYYNLIAPASLGVYPAIGKCYYIASQDKRNMSTYYLSNGKLTSGTILDTQTLDGNYLVLTTDKNGGLTINNRVNATFNSTSFWTGCGGVGEQLMTGVTIGWTGIWNTNTLGHDINIQIYNYTSNSWIALPNSILAGSGGTPFTVTNSFSTNNITKFLGITSTNPMQIRFADTNINEGAKALSTDYLYASCDQLASPTWETVQGSAEMHVTSNSEYNFAVTTLCNHIQSNLLDSSCSIIDPTVVVVNNITLYEGTIKENITITNTAGIDQSVHIHYVTPASIDCTAFISATRYDAATNNLSDINYANIIFSTATDASCDVEIPVELKANSTTQVINLVFDNYMKWEVLRANNIRQAINTSLDYCRIYGATFNYTFNPPLTSEPVGINDSTLLYCIRTYDDFWYFDYYYGLSQGISTSGEYESYHYEIADYYLPKMLKENDFVELHTAAIARTAMSVLIGLTPQYVWNYNQSRNLTYYAPANLNPSEYNQIAGNVWNSTNRSLTLYVDMTNYTLVGNSVWTSSATISVGLLNQIINAIWGATNRNLTYYPPQVDMTNYTLIAQTNWNYAIRNLTFTQDVTNYNNIIVGVWNATDRNLTYYPAQIDMTNYTTIINNVIGGVWNATNRNLTFYPTQIDLTNYTQVANSVWNAVSRNLTYTADVTNYNNIIVGVWNYTTRNLTFYPAQTDMTNYTRIDQTILAVNQTLFDKITASTAAILFRLDEVNNSLTAQILSVPNLVWTFNNRNLTFYPSQTDMTNYTEIATVVWNNAVRNLTYYPVQTDLTNYTAIINGVTESVWNASNRSLTLYVDTTNYNNIAIGVWNYSTRNLTYYQVTNVDYNQIVNDVWNATERNLTYYPAQVDMTNYAEIATVVWNATDRNLTYYPAQIDMTNYSEIVIGVWNATTRNLTYYPAQVDMTNYTLITNNVVGGVWNATDRNLTFYPTAVDLTNYTQIADTVWNAASRNLTYTEDVTNYNNIIVGVWNATNRNLTFYPAQTDMTNYTLIENMIINNSINYTLVADNVWQWNGVIVQNILNQVGSSTSNYVWNETDRNLTYYPPQVDMTNYTLLAETVWNNLNRTLTDFNFTVNANVNETAIANAVWQNVDRTLTSFNFTVNATVEANNTAIADAVWNAVNRTLTDYNQSDLTDYNKIQQMVWNATERNLTYYQNFGDQTNYTLIQEMVWDATNRSLTEFNFSVNVNNTAIADAVWASVNRSLTDYNQSDLTNYAMIQAMVWNATQRTLTDFNFTVNVNQTQLDNVVNYTLIQDMVWEATNRTLSEFNFTVTVNETALADAVWASSNRTLSYYPQWADLTNYTLIQEVVWDASVRTLTDFNFTVNATINNTDVAVAVWAYTNKTVQFANGSVDTVNDIQDMGHTYVGGTEYTDGDNGKITIRLVRGTGSLAEIETGANCTVSITYPNNTYFIFNETMSELGDGAYYYNFIVPQTLGIYPYFTNCLVGDRKYFSLDDFHIYANNYSSIPGNVWDYTARNLTYYPPENNLTAQDVWNNPTRELTYYPTTNISLTNESIQELGTAVWNYNGVINSNILTQFANTISCTIQNIQTDLNLKWGVQLNSC